MMNPLLTKQYEDEILELIQNADEYTTSDLQGIVSSIVNKIIMDGYRLISDLKKEDKD